MSPLWIVAGFFFMLAFFGILLAFAIRYRRCPSDKILVVYGKVGGDDHGRGLSAKCYHGGATFIWPVIQDYQYLDLTPIPIDIQLTGALSQQNIRVNTPSTFTVGVSTEPGVMENAAERLLGLTLEQIQELAKDIIFGQMRVAIATMPIEEINADRDKLIDNISNGVEVELKKVGLRLINVNIQDITDESGYIDALGKEAAARAINEAKIKVAQQQRDGEIGKAEAERDQRVRVASANATAVDGENTAAVEIAESNADRREQEAEFERRASAAEKVKQAKALEEAYFAEQESERARAKREEATQEANIIVPAEIEKKRIETLAEAEAEKTRRLMKGEADGKFFMMEAEGLGLMEILSKKAEGFRQLVESCGASAEMASLMMVIEQLPNLVEEQVKAISNLKIDSVTVWEGGKRENGKSNTADFISSLVGSLPPLHDITRNVGLKLPEYLGTISDDPDRLAKVGEQLKARAGKLAEMRQPVQNWLEDNVQLLASFDKNKDGRIDKGELSFAVDLAFQWAGRIADKSAKWLFFGDDQYLGPFDWQTLTTRIKDQPLTFINLEGTNLWLPFQVIKLAIEQLARFDQRS